MEEKLKELREKKDELEKEIQTIEKKQMIEQLKRTEDRFLGKCYENEELFFKVVCVVSANEYRVSIIGFNKEPRMINKQGLFDSYFHRHPFQGETTLDFMIEDDIMIRDLKEYKEITKEKFEELLRESMEKLSKEMDKVFEIKC